MKKETQGMPEEIWLQPAPKGQPSGKYYAWEVHPHAIKYIRSDLALQQKPAVLEGERAVALADLNYFEKFMATVPPDGYVMKDFFRPSSLETIKAALQSSAVEEKKS